jgi:hypothetical protein
MLYKIKKIYPKIANRFYRPNPAPIFLLGNQKSGTTIIAYLLSKRTGLTLTNDITRSIPDSSLYLRIRFELQDIDQMLKKYSYEFSKEIIKEPSLTFILPDLITSFPNARYVFISRNPYQNIRSILNRLKIPGNLSEIDMSNYSELALTPVWKLAFNSEWLGSEPLSYIGALAYRWKYAEEIYNNFCSNEIKMCYEDFLMDKLSFIDRLANTLDLKITGEISDLINKQMQPKGNSKVNLIEFFGNNNIEIIHKITGVEPPTN